MADSHGDAASVDAAADLLRTRGCERCFHLGDLVDTNLPHTATTCLERLRIHRIAAIRGNNEQSMLHHGWAGADPAAVEVIRAMPLTRRLGPALLTHSLPFAAAMGARCMIEDLGADHIRAWFRSHSGRLLFRGHGHRPEIIRPTATAFSREQMRPEKRYALASGQPALITCGALAEGFCLLWDRSRQTVTSLVLAGPRGASHK